MENKCSRVHSVFLTTRCSPNYSSCIHIKSRCGSTRFNLHLATCVSVDRITYLIAYVGSTPPDPEPKSNTSGQVIFLTQILSTMVALFVVYRATDVQSAERQSAVRGCPSAVMDGLQMQTCCDVRV